MNAPFFHVEGVVAGEQLHQGDAQGEDVGAGVQGRFL